MWIYTKAEPCDGHRRPPQDLRQNAQDHHGKCELGNWWFSVGTWVGHGAQRSLERKRHLGIIELWYWRTLPALVGLVWFSAPSSLDRKFANNDTKVAKFREIVNMAIEITFNVPFDGVHTPRTCSPREVSVLLSCAPDMDWDLDEELREWGLGEDPLLPPYSGGGDAPQDACSENSKTLGQMFRQYVLVPYLL